MPEEQDTQAHELRREQESQVTAEREALAHSQMPDEEDQHRRRADKAAYLAEKLAARERSERKAAGKDPAE